MHVQINFPIFYFQIVTLVELHQFTAVYGPSCSGKTSAIQVAAETVRHNMMSSHQAGHFSLTTIAVGAMEEEQLLGYQKQDERYIY